MSTWQWICIGTAAVILTIKHFLERDIDSNFAITREIREFFNVYKKGIKWLIYRFKTRKSENRMKFKDWSESMKYECKKI